MSSRDLIPTAGPSGQPPAPPVPEPTGVLSSFNELLTSPIALVRRADSDRPLRSRPLVVGALVCLVLYGAIAGMFQGGSQVALAAFKAPMIVFLSFLLCLPSLYVFGAVAGADWSLRRLLGLFAGFVGTVGLLLVGLLPIVWLFSVSSRYLTTVVWLHVLGWLLTLCFAWRFLRLALGEAGARGGMFLWIVLFCIVSLQVATALRPVLWREPTAPAFTSEKRFFIEQLGEVGKVDDRLKPGNPEIAPLSKAP